MKCSEAAVGRIRSSLSRERADQWKDRSLKAKEELEKALPNGVFMPGSMRAGECWRSSGFSCKLMDLSRLEHQRVSVPAQGSES